MCVCVCVKFVVFIIGKIVEEWMPLDPHLEELYLINYKPSDCSHPKVVVDRARSRVDECRFVALYSLLVLC